MVSLFRNEVSVAEVARSRSPRTPLEASEIRELRARVGQQAEVIEELRREVGLLIEELLGKKGNDAGASGSDLPGDDGLPPDWRPMVHAMRHLVYRYLPQGSRLAVVSSGVEPLLRFAGYHAEHLSQDGSGAYSGSHPSSGRVALVQLEAARWRGSEFLLLPHSELWWLEHYPELANHLEHRYARVAEDDRAGVVWDLRSPGPLRPAHDLLCGLCIDLDRRPSLLDWRTGHDLEARFDGFKVFSPLGDAPVLPYLEGTVDVVAVGDDTVEYMSEARRVASALVVHVPSDPRAAIEVLWQANGIDEASDVSIAVATSEGEPPAMDFVRLLLDTLPFSFAGEIVLDAACGVVPRASGSSSRRRPRTKLVRCRSGEDLRARLRRCAAAATGDLLVVVDASMRPVPGWLRPLVRPLRNREVGFVTGQSVEPAGRLVGPAVLGGGLDASLALRDDLDAPRYTRARRLEETSAGFFATRRRLFLEWDATSSLVPDPARAFSAYVSAGGGAVLYEPETIAISTSARATTSRDGSDA
jgi:hypothetical protein